jgi:hypothetical protein
MSNNEEVSVAIPPIPVKTADGQAELVNRQRRLSQRHRTMLLLVDGRRTEQEVKTLAQKAGATASCFGELVELGLIAVSQPTDPMTSTIPISPPAPPAEDDILHVDIPIPDPLPPDRPAPQSPARASRPASDDDLEPMLPASRTLQPDSVLTDSMLGEQKMTDSMLDEFESLGATRTEDSSLEEARGILLRAVRAEAPLTGSLTMMRLRRARTRIELSELIDEVETRIIKPYRSLAAQQVLRRARHLLDTRTNPLATS